jgi:hypothetical protein
MTILDKMIAKYDEGNLVKMSVKAAFIAKQGILIIPFVSTSFIAHNSATSVTLEGYIVEDGGAIITNSGIAWGSVHNPDLNENIEESDAISGAFNITLNNLTEGNIYFARTYATNTVGTAYGNCIEFVAEAEINAIENPEVKSDFVIYPNPSNGVYTLRLMVNKDGPVDLNIYDMNGRLVYTRNLGLRLHGETKVSLDVSALNDGVYNCQVVNVTDRITTRLVIQR